MEFGFGLITCQRHPSDRRSDVELYREALALAEEAERLGFDSVWVSEHHFFDDGYMPSLLPVCAAMAARTTRVKIGTGVLLAPLYEPLRLAEDAATVDLLSAGRLVLGLGLGWRPEELDAFRVAPSRRPRLLEDTVATLRQAWSDGLVTGGSAVRYPGVAVTPKPVRPGGPPIWIGAHVEPAIRRAARIADGFMATWSTPESLAEGVRWVRDELERAGRDPEGFGLCLHLATFAWVDGDAWQRARDYYGYIRWKYQDMAEARGRTGPPPPPPPLEGERETALRRLAVVGTPEEVVERLRRLEEAAGGGLHYVADLYCPGMDAGVQREALAIFASEVIPRLR